MDYQAIYDKLIYNALQYPYEGYTELHHIVPKCIGGDGKKSNLVKLSAKQHFVAHHLLFKIYGGSQMAYAWYSMCRVGKGQEERLVNIRLFDKAKLARAKLLRENSIGELNNFFGKTHSEKSRLKMSVAQKEMRLWENRSEEHKSSLLISQKKPKSTDHRVKIGRKNMVMLQNKYSGDIIRVHKDDPRAMSDDWVNPRTLSPETKYPCIHCGLITTPSNLKRWHNDNCKQRK